jgi:hypothetical protein
MTISEREAHELVRPLEALPIIEVPKAELRPKRRRRPLRVAVAIGAIGILGTGSAVAAIEKLSGGDEAKRERKMTNEQRQLKRISEASDQELRREVEARSGGSIPPSTVDSETTRQRAEKELEIGFPGELRFYDAQHTLVHMTKCTWPHPNPDCVDPIEAIRNYPSAKIVETWSNGKPIAGGS